MALHVLVTYLDLRRGYGGVRGLRGGKGEQVGPHFHI